MLYTLWYQPVRGLTIFDNNVLVIQLYLSDSMKIGLIKAFYTVITDPLLNRRFQVQPIGRGIDLKQYSQAYVLPAGIFRVRVDELTYPLYLNLPAAYQPAPDYDINNYYMLLDINNIYYIVFFPDYEQVKGFKLGLSILHIDDNIIKSIEKGKSKVKDLL